MVECVELSVETVEVELRLKMVIVAITNTFSQAIGLFQSKQCLLTNDVNYRLFAMFFCDSIVT